MPGSEQRANKLLSQTGDKEDSMRQAAGHREAPRQAWAGAAGRRQGEEADGGQGPRQEAPVWRAGHEPGGGREETMKRMC